MTAPDRPAGDHRDAQRGPTRIAARNGTLAARLQRAWLARGALALALWPLSLLFGAIGAVRRGLYRSGLLKAEALPVPVIVVGNLIAGGAGKTPTVIAVVELLRRRGFTPGVISRGYGGAAGAPVRDVSPESDPREVGDEPVLIRLRTGAPIIVGRDRVAAGRELLRRYPAVDVIVSDDGLQHLRLARTAQILVFDERGGGNGWLLPAGPLREPVPRAVPPRSVVLYNAPGASTPLPGFLASRRLAGVIALEAWRAGSRSNASGFDSLRGRPALAAAGIANPERFFAMLRAESLDIVPLPLADHRDYSTLPWPETTADVIVTEKDAVKLDPARLDLAQPGTTRVWVAALDFAPAAGFDAALLAMLPRPHPSLFSKSARPHGNATP